ncbi:MAG: phosphodiester glycosidase family protein [Thermoleophilaceae bacterium]|nr:phosphodiester glycosidase family protein [Thermoleophilaceae bacterium]
MGLALPASPRPALRSWSRELADGRATRVHVTSYPLASVRPRVVRLDPPRRLLDFCSDSGVEEAIVGGFFTRASGTPLGEIWSAGERLASEPWERRWHEVRGCAHFENGQVALASWGELPEQPHGDLIQAGPMLVSEGRSLIEPGYDPEGFSSGSMQFDSDITSGRYPRAALGLTRDSLIAAVCDGRSWSDAGMTLEEMADLLLDLGAHAGLNLDGGGSTTLISGGRLRNRPREEHGIELAGGRPITTAIVFG